MVFDAHESVLEQHSYQCPFQPKMLLSALETRV